MHLHSDSPRSASMRATPFVALLALALLGCPSDDAPQGDASSGPGPGSGGAETTSEVSATGMLPPASSSDSGTTDAVDTTASTTLAPTSEGSSETVEPPCEEDDSQGCGNGLICGTEECDCGGMVCTPEGLGFAECAGLVNRMVPDRVYTGGTLDCSPASCQYVFTACTYCGDGTINGNETCEPDLAPQDTCASLGLGDATEPLPCDASCQLDTSSCR